ncbi:MAG TPA: LysM peptidoglycan-binding domain-containing M23 family metallopeptidase [Sandaracinaceae bacterium LLY-WYZ-13_1]|nr:LysM peptidoglycan-binding domain-containing M23 family metallopeptidase [Sandaracinaceae bacterium LLY-WYZ-13_1]
MRYLARPFAMTATPSIPRAARVSALVALVAAAWPGCTEEPAAEPVPEVEAAPPEDAEPEPAEPEGPPPGVDHEIAEGQTLWEIARSYGVSVQEIMDANDMRPRDVRRLRAGQTLRVPGATETVEVEETNVPEELPEIDDGAYHRLADGETLWDVARLYEVSLSELQERNELDDDAVRLLRPGQAIVIPGATERDVERATEDRDQRLAESDASRGFRHTVSEGETIWDLAGAFGVTTGEIMAANGLSEARVRNLRAGARLWIPGVERDAGGRVRRRLTGRQRRALRRARNLGLGTRQAASRLLHGRVERRWVRAASRGRRRSRLPGNLRWPVTNGWFVRGYGSGEGGYHLAVDIMGRIGWNVRAAAPGIVGYAGDEVRGYGNMVLLVHPGGWVTMYAHNSANSVVAGQRVPRGGIIGEVGSTGISRGPHVHFEFIFDGQNCDPATLFRPGIRHRDGHLSPIPRATWRRPDDEPERMRCHRRMRHPRSRWVQHESF